MKPNRSWSGYVIEFLMLFAAVTLGFFAENLREGIGEKSKARNLAIALKNDLVQDTVILTYLINFYENKTKNQDSLFDLLNKPFNKIDQQTYYRQLQMSHAFQIYTPTGGALTELKNSGYLNLLSDKPLSDFLTHYENLIAWQHDNVEREKTTVLAEQVQLLCYVTNLELFSKAYARSGREKYMDTFAGLPASIGIDPISSEHLIALRGNLVLSRVFATSYVISFNNIKQTAAKMIKHLREKYP